MSTIREIARELNLSHTTVSRVLNTRNEHTISPATRERIWEAARAMGYRPHAAARALATGRSQIIALLMPFLYSAFHAEVVHEIEQNLRLSGYQLLVATVDWSDANARSGLHMLSAPVDGYLALETASHIQPLLDTLRAGTGRNAPVVAMGGRNIGDSPGNNVDRIGFDLAAGADLAMGHLLSLGKRRIAFVGMGQRGNRYGRYAEAMREAGLPEIFIPVASEKRVDTREPVRRFFDALPPGSPELPDALFCFNDEIAIGAYRALRDRKIEVGREVALIGFDGISDLEYLDTPVTTVALPIREMCRLAWEALHSRLADPALSPTRIMLQPRLIVRESTVPEAENTP